MSIDVLRQELYGWCRGNAACIRAADYYIALLQNPCYPPAVAARNEFYIDIVKRYGRPPSCDVKALVAERLSGTPLEKHIDEIVRLAELVKRELGITARVAAAAATIFVAEWHACCIVRNRIAAIYGVSYNAVRKWLPYARWLYITHIARR